MGSVNLNTVRLRARRLFRKMVSDMEDVRKEVKVTLLRSDRPFRCSSDIIILSCALTLLVTALFMHSKLTVLHRIAFERTGSRVRFVNSPENYLRDLFYPNCDQGVNISEHKARAIQRLLSDRESAVRTRNCIEYFQNFPVEAANMTDEELMEERSFTFAFSHQVHKSAGILELFLSILYRYVQQRLLQACPHFRV